MALTEKQEIPQRPEVKQQGWTRRSLFPFAATVSTLTKTFSNPFDILLGFVILVISLTEILGRHPSWMLYVFAVLILFVDFAVRNKEFTNNQDTKK